MADETEIETRALAPVAAQPVMELSAGDIKARLDKIIEVQKLAMKAKIDYGVIPGTGTKPTLLKAGAEKLCVLFRLDAQFDTQQTFDGSHMTALTKCVIYHQVTGQRLGAASAMCSSKESKYAFRKASRTCPACGKETLIHTKRNPEDWWCNKYRDGCGANFDKDDSRVIGQQVGRIANADVADQFPTVLRMAEKRALIAAVRLVTGASAIFDEPMTDSADADDDTALQAGFDSEHPLTTEPDNTPPKLNPNISRGDVPVIAAAEIGKLKAVAALKKGKDAFPWWRSKLVELGITDETMTRPEYDAIKFELEASRPDPT